MTAPASSPSSSHRCFFRIADDRCVHPLMHGHADDARCSACPHYKGRARGLGDIVHKVTTATGVAGAMKAVERVTGKPCNCGQRRAALNAAVPFSDKVMKEQ